MWHTVLIHRSILINRWLGDTQNFDMWIGQGDMSQVKHFKVHGKWHYLSSEFNLLATC